MYVVYNKETTRYLKNHPKVKTNRHCFGSLGAAKSALTREVKHGAVVADDFAICALEDFGNIEKYVEKINLMSGKTYRQLVNTPMVCDPSTETYWSI